MLAVKARVGELPPKGCLKNWLEKEGCSRGRTKKESLGVPASSQRSSWAGSQLQEG